MSTFRRKLQFKLFKLSDVSILIISLLIASWFVAYPKPMVTLGDFFSMRIKIVNFIGFLSMIIVWHFLIRSFHLYHSRRLGSGLHEWKNILKVTTIGTSMFALIGLIFHITAFTPSFIGVFWVSSTILTISFRYFLRRLLYFLTLFLPFLFSYFQQMATIFPVSKFLV